MLALDQHLAILPDRTDELFVIIHAAHQNGGAAIHETLGQSLVQGVGQAILDRQCALLPMGGVVEPVGAVGDIGPAANMGDAAGQGVDIAVHQIDARDLFGNPVDRQAAGRRREMAVEPGQQADMGVRQDLAEIGNLGDLP